MATVIDWMVDGYRKLTGKEKPVARVQSDEWREVHELAMRRFRDGESATRDQREQSLEDRRFYSKPGAQWENHAFELQFENKPRLEINKVHLSIIRIFNEWRNNRIDVTFSPKDGSKNEKLSDKTAELYRADAKASQARQAFDTAFEEGVGGGMGACRVRAVYDDEADDENEYQRMSIEPIADADQLVIFDPDARLEDKSDAKWCFVLTPMTHEAYKSKYGDDVSSWPKSSMRIGEWEWSTPDLVYVAEYYVVENRADTVEVWRNIVSGEEQRLRKSRLDAATEEGADPREALELTGHKLVATKRIRPRAVRKWVLSGNGVLEDCKHIAGDQIPIVPYYAKRWLLDGTEHWMGHVRLCKDAQRLTNVMMSKLAEIGGKSSVEKPILHPEQITSWETMWARDNIEDYPYLLINQLRDANKNPIASGPIGYTKPPTIPEALAALLQITAQDLKDMLGNPEMAEQVQSNISGKLMDLVQQRIDMQSFIYIDQMRKFVERVGKVWLSGARDIYVEEGRVMKGLNASGQATQIELGKQVVDTSGATVTEMNMDDAVFDVDAEAGPSTASRKQSIVRQLASIAGTVEDPEDKQVIMAMIFANMEGEGLADVRNYFRRKMIRMKVVEPTPEEAERLKKEQAEQQPDANTKYLEAAAAQAEAEGKQAIANVLLKLAQAEKTGAETQKIISETDEQQQTQALALIDRVAPNLGLQPREQPDASSAEVQQ